MHSRPRAQAPPLSDNPSASSIKTRETRHLLRSISNRMLRRPRSRVQILDETPAYARIKPRVTVVFVRGKGP